MNHIQKKAQAAGEAVQDLASAMVRELQNVLKHERKHFNFYLQASMELRGTERLYLKPLLEKEMQSELAHIRQFGDKIVALGQSPTHEAHPFNFGNSFGEKLTICKVLSKAVEMEREVLQVYHDLYPKAEKFAEVFDDMSIVLLLEENIEHTTADVEEMEKILGG
jgi:bacterioferritin (cytochrome b1)